MHLLDRVRATIDRHDLLGPGSRVLVALSGGGDSVALALLLRQLQQLGGWQLVGLAHFDHGLRQASPDDARFCRDFAERLRVPIVVEAGDVRSRARRERRSLEAAAHEARYEFLARAAAALDADRIALGHTRDDQAETFLLRLLRGAGSRGLGSMHPRVGRHVRPLIECRRLDVRRHLDENGEPYLHDATNDDLSVPRNRIRAELMPLLEARFNPAVVEVLADASDIAREDWRWLEAEARVLLESGRLRQGGGVTRLDAAVLASAPPAVARAAMLCAIEQVSSRGTGRQHVDRALALARARDGRVDLPGLRVERFGPDLVLMGTGDGRGRLAVASPSSHFSYSLAVPGAITVPEALCKITAKTHQLAGDSPVFDRPERAVVGFDRPPSRLTVRNRRPGDRFRPFGLSGHKKLQDFFVDRKVPRQRRALVPLVVDEDDKIVWVAGYTVAEDFRVTGPAQAVIMLTLSPLGGPA